MDSSSMFGRISSETFKLTNDDDLSLSIWMTSALAFVPPDKALEANHFWTPCLSKKSLLLSFTLKIITSVVLGIIVEQFQFPLVADCSQQLTMYKQCY